MSHRKTGHQHKGWTISGRGIFNGCVAVSIFMMVLLIFVNASCRYLFNTGFTASEELSRFFFIWTVFLGIIVAYKDGEHVAVTILTDKLKGKCKLLAGILADLFSLIALGAVLTGGIRYTLMSATRKSVATGVNFAFITVSIVIMAIGVLFLMVKNIVVRIRSKEY